jgi:hypothetical protein
MSGEIKPTSTAQESSDNSIESRLMNIIWPPSKMILIKGLKSIDNVHIDAEIHMVSPSNQSIQIILRYAHIYAFKYVPTYWVLATGDQLMNKIVSLGSLKYNRTTGDLFKSPNDLHTSTICDDIASMIAVNSTSPVKLSWNECSVCLDRTNCETVCGHHLCLQCHSKMVEHKDYKCPLCRHTLADDY